MRFLVLRKIDLVLLDRESYIDRLWVHIQIKPFFHCPMRFLAFILNETIFFQIYRIIGRWTMREQGVVIDVEKYSIRTISIFDKILLCKCKLINLSFDLHFSYKYRIVVQISW